MRHNRVRLCGSKSSTNVLTQMRVAYGAGGSKETSEFVNHGLLLWNQGRRKWIGHRKRKGVSRSRLLCFPKLRALCIRVDKKIWLCCWKTWNTSNHSLLKSSKPFPKPIPLGEMVDFLVDIWEKEGI